MALVEAIAIVFHILLSLAIITLVLLHSGKGGGLSDVFGGIDVYLSHFLSLMVDSDGENLNEGLYAHWKGLNMSIAYVEESTPAYRIGYNLNLNHR